MTTTSRNWEAALVVALTTLTAAMLILVEITPNGSDRYVWLGGLVVMGAAAVLWRMARWPARPTVVIAVSLALVVVAYGIWMWWYIATRVPQSA